jgi:hypothetical protein
MLIEELGLKSFIIQFTCFKNINGDIQNFALPSIRLQSKSINKIFSVFVFFR